MMILKPISEIHPHALNQEIYCDASRPDHDLVESIRRIGIQTPLILTQKNSIISGHRRYYVAKKLDLKEVPVVYSELIDDLEIEQALIESNRQRIKTNEQIAKEYSKLKSIEAEKAKRRMQLATGGDRKSENWKENQNENQGPANSPEVGEAREKAAKALEIGYKKAEEAVKVVEKIEELKENGEIEEAENLREILNNKSVNAAYQVIKHDVVHVQHTQPSQPVNAVNDNEILLADCFDIFPKLPATSFDTIILDPPYQMGVDKWDKFINIESVITNCFRLCKETGFVCIFGQFPSLLKWINIAQTQGGIYKNDIVWIKRAVSRFLTPVRRAKEHIFIFASSVKAKYYKTTGTYEDVKLDGLPMACYNIENIKREMSKLRKEFWKEDKPTQKTGCEAYQKKFKYTFQGLNRYPGKENTNVTDVWALEAQSASDFFTHDFVESWSFLPDHFDHHGQAKSFHPTMKPVKLITRLLELTTPPFGRVFDPFSGSGSTAVCAKNLGINFVAVENNKDFWKASVDRLNSVSLHG